MKTKKTILPLIVIAFGVMAFSAEKILYSNNDGGLFQNEKNATECLVKYESKWGEPCDNCNNQYSKSFRIKYRNTCKEKLDVKCAVQEENKTWRTFSWTAMAPNDTMVAYACSGTGKSRIWARISGNKEVTFPTDNEINNRYKD